MKKLKKVNTTKRKNDRRQAEKALQQRTSMLLNHPTECCVCETLFERTKETVKAWHVVIREERVRLTCPKCWDIVNEVLKNPNVKNS